MPRTGGPHPGPQTPSNPGGPNTGGWHPGPGGPPNAPGPGTPYTNPGPGAPPAWTDAMQSAFAQLATLLEQYGLSSLQAFLKDLILQGNTDSASLMLALQQTNEWKTRFAGNEMLRQQGLGVLSPAEYLALERSYAQIMRNYGLPQGFYDEPADFAKWIGNNVSAAELQQRVSAYADLANREDPAIVAQLSSMGMTRGDLLAYMMDPDRAAPLIQRQYQVALLGGAARRAGLGGQDVNNDYLSQLAGRGVSEQQAAQGYGLIAGSLADARTLSGVYGVDYGLHDMETEVFDNNATAGKKRRRLASQERAAFSGQSGQSGISGSTAGSY